MAVTTQLNVSIGICGGRTWRAGCTGCASAEFDNFDVLGTGSACEQTCASRNTSTMRDACFRCRDKGCVRVGGKKVLRSNKLSGAAR